MKLSPNTTNAPRALLVSGRSCCNVNVFHVLTSCWLQTLKKVGPAVEGEGNAIGWAAREPAGKLSPYKFTRRAVGANDVFLQITHAGLWPERCCVPGLLCAWAAVCLAASCQ